MAGEGDGVIMEKNSLHNTPREFAIAVSDLPVTAGRVARMMGYADTPPLPVQEALDRCFAELEEHVSPCGGYRICDRVGFSEKTFQCEQVMFEPGRRVTGYLEKSDTLAFFLVTAGPGMDAWSRQAGEQGDAVLQYTIDTAGSELAEAAADRIEEKIREAANERRFTITNRYSPGYCGWHVSEQHRLFSLFPRNFCGISLTPSSLMIPAKSVSGVIGMGAKTVRKAYQCSLCDMKNCIMRGKR